MADLSFLEWPFFEDRHRALARELEAWAHEHVAHAHGPDVDAECVSGGRQVNTGRRPRPAARDARSDPPLVHSSEGRLTSTNDGCPQDPQRL